MNFLMEKLHHVLDNIHPFHIFLSLFNIVVFVVAGTVIYFVSTRQRRLVGSRHGVFGFLVPIREWLSLSALTDLSIYAVTKSGVLGVALASNVALGLVAAGLIQDLLTFLCGARPAGLPGGGILLTAGLLAFICRDFMNFYIHYLEHKVPLLWEFHKVHHSAASLNPLTANRFHPVQIQLDALAEGFGLGLVYGVFGYFYRITAVDIAFLLVNIGWVVQLLILEPLQHSHVPLSFGRLDDYVYSPRMHQIHHSAIEAHWDRNFGSTITLWDRLFACYYKPVEGEAVEIGLDAQKHLAYRTILHCYLLPFLGCYRILTGTAGREGAVADPA